MTGKKTAMWALTFARLAKVREWGIRVSSKEAILLARSLRRYARSHLTGRLQSKAAGLAVWVLQPHRGNIVPLSLGDVGLLDPAVVAAMHAGTPGEQSALRSLHVRLARLAARYHREFRRRH